jgi:hypothetical protein
MYAFLAPMHTHSNVEVLFRKYLKLETPLSYLKAVYSSLASLSFSNGPFGIDSRLSSFSLQKTAFTASAMFCFFGGKAGEYGITVRGTVTPVGGKGEELKDPSPR